MDTNNEETKKTKLVIDALDYAHTHNLAEKTEGSRRRGGGVE